MIYVLLAVIIILQLILVASASMIYKAVSEHKAEEVILTEHEDREDRLEKMKREHIDEGFDNIMAYQVRGMTGFDYDMMAREE